MEYKRFELQIPLPCAYFCNRCDRVSGKCNFCVLLDLLYKQDTTKLSRFTVLNLFRHRKSFFIYSGKLLIDYIQRLINDEVMKEKDFDWNTEGKGNITILVGGLNFCFAGGFTILSVPCSHICFVGSVNVLSTSFRKFKILFCGLKSVLLNGGLTNTCNV